MIQTITTTLLAHLVIFYYHAFMSMSEVLQELTSGLFVVAFMLVGFTMTMKKDNMQKWYVTKCTRIENNPYSGPAWKDDKPRWFDTKEEAEDIAKELGTRNPAGFSAKQIAPGCRAGKYPWITKDV